MQSDYALQYESLWRRHWWWRSREQFVLSQLRSLHARKPLARILDVGCGNGLFFSHLQQFGEVRGIEPDAGLVTPDGPFRSLIDVRPFDDSVQPSAAPDIVLMLDVLEHIEDHLSAARHVHRILAPGGIFLLTVPAMMWLWSAHDDANRHYRRYTRSTLRDVLTRAGFRIESLRYFFFWTLAPLLARRALSPRHDPARSYHVAVPAGPVNAAMYALSRLEQTTLGRRGMPAGSSLIAVARKDG